MLTDLQGEKILKFSINLNFYKRIKIKLKLEKTIRKNKNSVLD